jgi:putative endonuclease
MVSNKTRSTLYIGVTNDLLLRIAQHRRGEISGFTRDCHCRHLVYGSHFRDIRDVIAWEKQLKGWRRSKKNAFVERDNPRWEDLAKDWFSKHGGRNSQILRLRSAQDDKKECVEPSRGRPSTFPLQDRSHLPRRQCRL